MFALTPTLTPRFTTRTLLVATAILALTMGSIAWWYKVLTSAELSEELVGAMKQAQLGLINYESAKGALPPAVRVEVNGKPLSSWRFQVVPFTGFNEGAAYNAPWDAPVNRPLISSWAAIKFCVQFRQGNRNTSVFAVTGPGTAFDPPHAFHWDDLPQELIVLIDVGDSQTHWMQPGDYDVTKLLAAKGRIGDHLHGVMPDRIHVLFADGELWGISADAPMSALQPFLTLTGAEASDREVLLRPHSAH